MKMVLWRAALALFFIATAIVFLYGVRECDRAAKEEKMDRRELHYDADGEFIMIDTQDGHMGVYDAVKPVRHIWINRLKRIKPGVYNLDVCSGWIELYNNSMEGVYVVKMDEKNDRFFHASVSQGAPVLVY